MKTKLSLSEDQNHFQKSLQTDSTNEYIYNPLSFEAHERNVFVKLGNQNNFQFNVPSLPGQILKFLWESLEGVKFVKT